jgi:hypothetical protein
VICLVIAECLRLANASVETIKVGYFDMAKHSAARGEGEQKIDVSLKRIAAAEEPPARNGAALSLRAIAATIDRNQCNDKSM